MNTSYSVPAKSTGMLDYAPYSTVLGPSNTIGAKPPIYGRFSLTPSTYQQPNTPPPTPRAGLKGILSEPPISPVPSQHVQLFTPSPDYDIGQPL